MGKNQFEFHVGSEVEVQTVDGEEMTGEVFAYDKYTKTLVLKEGDTIRMINANMIKTPRGVVELKPALTGAKLEPLPAVDPARSLKKEAEAVKAAKAAAGRIGVGVSRGAQAVFEAIAKTMPVEWDGKTIVVLGEVRVEDPYGVENATAGPDGQITLKRVKLVIQAEEARLGMQTKN